MVLTFRTMHILARGLKRRKAKGFLGVPDRIHVYRTAGEMYQVNDGKTFFQSSVHTPAVQKTE